MKCAELAGELGTLDPGELLCDELAVECGDSEAGDHNPRLVGGDFGDLDLVGEPGKLSPDDSDLFSDTKLRLGVIIGDPGCICCSALLLLSLLNREVRFLLSVVLSLWFFFL